MSGRLLDPRDKSGNFPFTYRNSANTDVKKTWEEAKKRQEEIGKELTDKLRQIKRTK